MKQRIDNTGVSGTSRLLSISRSLIIAVMALLPCLSVTAQEGIEYSAKLDTNIIVIGDQINMELAVKQPRGVIIEFPSFNDSISSGIEIIKQNPQDTVPQKDNKILVKKNFLITSFDGGVHKIPPLEFTIHQQNFVNVIRTDTIALGVHTFEIDTTKGNFDIVMPYHAPVSFAEIAPWAIGGILLLGLIIFLIYYIRQRKRNKPLFSMPAKPQDPPHVIALNKLNGIKTQKMWQSGKIKLYHTQVTDTLRVYLEQRFGISTLECTTDEILDSTESIDELNKELKSQLEDILRRADLVKFAKYNPLPDENDKSLTDAYTLVNKTIKQETNESEKTSVVDSQENQQTTQKTLK